jgi:HK97 family phage major capsid protein
MSYTTQNQTLINEVIWEKMIEYMENEDISRRVFPVEFRNEGDSIKIVTEGQWDDAAEVSEGSEVPIYEPDYTSVTKTYKKIGYRVQITHEMLTDARFDMIRRGVRKAAQKISQKVSIDVLREAWNGAGLTYTVSGRWGGAYADEITDIATVEGKIRNKNYSPDTIYINPLDYAKLVPLRIFTEKDKGGDVSKYEIGKKILDLEIIVTPWISENNFLVLDTPEAGVLFIREDLRRAPYKDVPRDVEGQVFFMRYTQGVVAPSAICYATGY